MTKKTRLCTLKQLRASFQGSPLSTLWMRWDLFAKYLFLFEVKHVTEQIRNWAPPLIAKKKEKKWLAPLPSGRGKRLEFGIRELARRSPGLITSMSGRLMLVGYSQFKLLGLLPTVGIPQFVVFIWPWNTLKWESPVKHLNCRFKQGIKVFCNDQKTIKKLTLLTSSGLPGLCRHGRVDFFPVAPEQESKGNTMRED